MSDADLSDFTYLLTSGKSINVELARHVFANESLQHYRPLCAAVRAGRVDVVLDFIAWPSCR